MAIPQGGTLFCIWETSRVLPALWQGPACCIQICLSHFSNCDFQILATGPQQQQRDMQGQFFCCNKHVDDRWRWNSATHDTKTPPLRHWNSATLPLELTVWGSTHCIDRSKQHCSSYAWHHFWNFTIFLIRMIFCGNIVLNRKTSDSLAESIAGTGLCVDHKDFLKTVIKFQYLIICFINDRYSWSI